MSEPYRVSFEIAGPAAIFTRPDSGAAPVSYPAPTYSAAKGMFEAIARLKSAYVHPTKVEICRPIQYSHYVTNYGGPLRKSKQLSRDTSYQLIATILVDVCYRIYGDIKEVTARPGSTNHLHALQAIFTRRLERGQSFYTPCLGWKEFTPTYIGPIRANETAPEESISLTIPSMLHSVFDREGLVRPVFKQNVRIERGVLAYAE